MMNIWMKMSIGGFMVFIQSFCLSGVYYQWIGKLLFFSYTKQYSCELKMTIERENKPMETNTLARIFEIINIIIHTSFNYFKFVLN